MELIYPTAAEKGTEGSLEYLVYSNVFVGVAAQYGLVPVLQYDMPSLENVLDPVRRLGVQGGNMDGL